MSDDNDRDLAPGEVEMAHEPFDRLTRLCAQMTSVLDDVPDSDDVRVIVFISDEKKSGIQTRGFEDMNEAVAELFIHLRAMFRSMGKELDFVGFSEGDMN